jgi:phage baseplate assembly protein W
MSRLSFKNVGIREFTTEDTSTQSAPKNPIGIKTPVEIDGTGESLFKMNLEIADQVSDNLKNLILTNWGERVGKYNFGANLRPLLTEFTNKDNFDQEAMIRINTATSKWMPYISLENYVSETLHGEKYPVARIKLTIEYSVPQLNITTRSLEVILFVI